MVPVGCGRMIGVPANGTIRKVAKSRKNVRIKYIPVAAHPRRNRRIDK